LALRLRGKTCHGFAERKSFVGIESEALRDYRRPQRQYRGPIDGYSVHGKRVTYGYLGSSSTGAFVCLVPSARQFFAISAAAAAMVAGFAFVPSWELLSPELLFSREQRSFEGQSLQAK
jgi:hypothetical protein